MNENANYSLGIDIGSTTVKIAILDQDNNLVFSDYERHYANIQETLALLLDKARKQLGSIELSPMITGSGGLALSEHLKVPFVQEVVAVSTALEDYAPQTDVAIELGRCQNYLFYKWYRTKNEWYLCWWYRFFY